jgi:hypothetical protein
MPNMYKANAWFCARNYLSTLTMAPISVQIKHAGKLSEVQLDQDLPPNAFKEAIYQATGVPVDRMKVMVKGGVLKVCFHDLPI